MDSIVGMGIETMADVGKALQQHEASSQDRYEKLMSKVEGVANHEESEEDTMSAHEEMNIVGVPGMNGNDGFGMGGGLIGGLLVGALLGRGGRGGLFGGDDGVGCNGGANGLQSSIDTNSILQSLGDIKAAVPLAEAQVQLALAGQAASLTNQINSANIATLNGQSQLGLSIANALSTAKDLAAAQTQTLSELINGVGNQVDRNLYQLATTITNDGAATRALITTNQIADLNRLAQERQDEIIELRNGSNRDRDRHGIEINMIQNQNQNQMQFQQQAQVLAQLANCLAEVGQVARATNSNVIVGNTGASTTGAQTASPTNVRA